MAGCTGGGLCALGLSDCRAGCGSDDYVGFDDLDEFFADLLHDFYLSDLDHDRAGVLHLVDDDRAGVLHLDDARRANFGRTSGLGSLGGGHVRGVGHADRRGPRGVAPGETALSVG